MILPICPLYPLVLLNSDVDSSSQPTLLALAETILL